jgi:hypothetical protein
MKLPMRIMVVVLLVFTSSFGAAQTATSSLHGIVTDPSGALVVGATVTLESKETGFHQIHKTDKDGGYQFQQVQPATYAVTVASVGFAQDTSVVQLLVSQPATLNFQLRVVSSSTVEVQDSNVETLNTDNASVGNAVDEDTVQSLPMEGRNVPDLLSLQPGVLYLGQQNSNQQNNDSRSGSVAGARSDQGNITLDGIDKNSVFGYAFTGVLRSTIDSVEEFKVTTSNNGADTGRSSGAQINIVTRSGTNKIHAGLYEYNRNTATSANQWFNKEAEVAEGLPNTPGELIRNTFGSFIGGPIKKDKLYYFLNFSRRPSSSPTPPFAPAPSRTTTTTRQAGSPCKRCPRHSSPSLIRTAARTAHARGDQGTIPTFSPC